MSDQIEQDDSNEEPPQKQEYGLLFWIVAGVVLLALGGFLGTVSTVLMTR